MCCHLVSENEASAACLCSRVFVILIHAMHDYKITPLSRDATPKLRWAKLGFRFLNVDLCVVGHGHCNAAMTNAFIHLLKPRPHWRQCGRGRGLTA